MHQIAHGYVTKKRRNLNKCSFQINCKSLRNRRKIRSPRLIKKNADLLKKQLKKGGRKVTILTARRLGAPISHFFRTIGIDPYVVALGTGDPQAKADYIENEIKKGYDPIYFMDDSRKNINAVSKLKKKYPHITIVTSLVK